MYQGSKFLSILIEVFGILLILAGTVTVLGLTAMFSGVKVGDR